MRSMSCSQAIAIKLTDVINNTYDMHVASSGFVPLLVNLQYQKNKAKQNNAIFEWFHCFCHFLGQRDLFPTGSTAKNKTQL